VEVASKARHANPVQRAKHSRVVIPLSPVNRTGQAEINSILRSTGVQAKLTIGQPNDKYEQEADRVADQVMRMSDADVTQRVEAGAVQPMRVQRVCPECEEDMAQRQAMVEDEEFQAKEMPEQTSQVNSAVESRINSLKGSGQPLDLATRSFFEPRFGHDFSSVRVHYDGQAEGVSHSINARAFTLGSDIVFGAGEYAPSSFSGKKLLAHELTHVVQQKFTNQGAGSMGMHKLAQPRVMRLITHTGTPTNCHNWSIPLPPWIAGSLAHKQLEAYFSINSGSTGTLIPEVPIPRATKLAGAMVGVSSPPLGTPPGFADLWGLGPSSVQIGEIKSTYQGGVVATREAAHYLLRHTEWLGRSPSIHLDDIVYQALQGGRTSMLGIPMNGLAAVTGTGIPIGLFIGDPGKMLWAEADSTGAVCYWCVGAGIVNPAWALVLLPLLQSLADGFWAVVNAIGDFIDWIGEGVEGIAAWGQEYPVLAFIALLMIVIVGYVLAIILGFLEAPTLGADTPLTIGSFATATAALVALLALVGILGGDIEPAVNEMAAFANPQTDASGDLGADYERDADRGEWRSASVPGYSTFTGERLTVALNSLQGQVQSKVADLANPFVDSSGVDASVANIAKVNQAASFLSSHPNPRLQSLGSRVEQISKGIWA